MEIFGEYGKFYTSFKNYRFKVVRYECYNWAFAGTVFVVCEICQKYKQS